MTNLAVQYWQTKLELAILHEKIILTSRMGAFIARPAHVNGGGGRRLMEKTILNLHFDYLNPCLKFSWCVYNIIFQNYFQTKRILFIHNTLSSEPPLRNRIFSLRCDCYNIAKNYVAKIEPQKPMMRYVVRLQYFVKKKTAKKPQNAPKS